jgi:hypothetical protein
MNNHHHNSAVRRVMVGTDRSKTAALDAAQPVLHSICSRFREGVANSDLIEARNILEQLRA